MPMRSPRPSLMALSAFAITMAWAQASAAADLSVARRNAIDAHALAAPADVERSIPALAHYLTQHYSHDREKLRAIYRWIADRIEYDVDTYLSGKEINVSAAEVLSKRQSVCEGFASLFSEIASHAGLKVKNIPGYAKGFGTEPVFKQGSKPNHMWTAVEVDGEWRMIDATWGAGYVANGKYKKALSEAFFLVPPEQLAFSHFPSDPQWQLQKTPRLTMQQFSALPSLPITYFNNQISPLETWKTITSSEFSGALVQTFDLPVGLAKVSQAPLSHILRQESSYFFAIESENFSEMALVQGSHWTKFEKAGVAFTQTFKPHVPGDLMVMGKPPQSEGYVAILRYEVKP